MISIFTERALNGQPVSIFGDGEQTRDFVYVQDLVSILLQAVEVNAPRPGAVNIGLSRSTSLNDLIAELGTATGNPLTVNHQAPRQGDIRHSRANNARLLERFKLPEPTSIGKGLAQLIRSL
ncbi:UDP-glucose 4-epimerase [compost metagenome]